MSVEVCERVAVCVSLDLWVWDRRVLFESLSLNGCKHIFCNLYSFSYFLYLVSNIFFICCLALNFNSFFKILCVSLFALFGIAEAQANSAIVHMR